MLPKNIFLSVWVIFKQVHLHLLEINFHNLPVLLQKKVLNYYSTTPLNEYALKN